MSETLITVATTFDVVEAEFLRNHLETEGFEVFLADENIVGANNWLANAVGGVKIKVSSADAADARQLIEKLRSAEVEYLDEAGEARRDADTGWGECPMCLSRDLKPERDFSGFKWVFAVFQLPTVKPERKLVCKNCGNEWFPNKSALTKSDKVQTDDK